jgi:hypothetical protein
MPRALQALSLTAVFLCAPAARALEVVGDGAGRSQESAADRILNKTQGTTTTSVPEDGGWGEDYGPHLIIRPEDEYRDVRVEMWTDRGREATYCPGDPVYISFRADSDAYVTIYDLDRYGRVHVLFPNPYHRYNFVRGGRTYTIPAGGYRFEVVGPAGREYLRAMASTDPDDRYSYGTRPRLWSRDWDDRVSPERFERPFRDWARSSAKSRPWERRGSRERDRYRGRVWWNFAEAVLYIEDGYRCGNPDYRYEEDRDRPPRPRPWDRGGRENRR